MQQPPTSMEEQKLRQLEEKYNLGRISLGWVEEALKQENIALVSFLETVPEIIFLAQNIRDRIKKQILAKEIKYESGVKTAKEKITTAVQNRLATYCFRTSEEGKRQKRRRQPIISLF